MEVETTRNKSTTEGILSTVVRGSCAVAFSPRRVPDSVQAAFFYGCSISPGSVIHAMYPSSVVALRVAPYYTKQWWRWALTSLETAVLNRSSSEGLSWAGE